MVSVQDLCLIKSCAKQELIGTAKAGRTILVGHERPCQADFNSIDDCPAKSMTMETM